MQTATNPIFITKMSVTFQRDLPGFIGARHFELEPIGEGSEAVFAHLRCTDSVSLEGGTPLESLALVVMSPGVFWRDYEVQIDENMVEELGLVTAEDVMLLAIVHPMEPLAHSTANLYSPIVINRHSGVADQLVPVLSENEVGWSVRTPFPTEGDD